LLAGFVEAAGFAVDQSRQDHRLGAGSAFRQSAIHEKLVEAALGTAFTGQQVIPTVADNHPL